MSSFVLVAFGGSPTASAQRGTQPLSGAPEGPYAVNDAFQDYVQSHGGDRVLGFPISNAFLLLAAPTQAFQRTVLQVRPDGTVGPLRLLDTELLPINHVDGLTLPGPEADLVGAAPRPDDEGYATTAVEFLKQWAPDDWNGVPVGFGLAVRAALQCADATPADVGCDDASLATRGLQIWGLPTSYPTPDPSDPDLLFLRFEFGTFQYARSTGITQPLPLGEWFKRLVLGKNLGADFSTDAVGSPLYALYSPSQSLAMARPSALPRTSLVGAFNSVDTLSAARAPTAQVALTQIPSGGMPTIQPGGAVAPPVSAPSATQTAVPFEGQDVCWGDEKMVFLPSHPYAGLELIVAATSAQRHNPERVRLIGPIKTGAGVEHRTSSGWSWEWSFTPPIEGSYEFTFYVDGITPCRTTSITALPSFGASPTPTAYPTPGTPTPIPTLTPIPTPTATPQPGQPKIDQISPASGCPGTTVTLAGSRFGASQSDISGVAYLGGRSVVILGWSNTSIALVAPADAGLGNQTLVLSTHGGFDSTTFRVNDCQSQPTAVPQVPTPEPTLTPTPAPTSTPTPAATVTPASPTLPLPTATSSPAVTPTPTPTNASNRAG